MEMTRRLATERMAGRTITSAIVSTATDRPRYLGEPGLVRVGGSGLQPAMVGVLVVGFGVLNGLLTDKSVFMDQHYGYWGSNRRKPPGLTIPLRRPRISPTPRSGCVPSP